MRRYLAALFGAALLVTGLAAAPTAHAATTRSVVAQTPSSPREGQTVRVWMNSDTAPGETAGLEYRIGDTYTKVMGSWDATTTVGANWYTDIPSQAAGTAVSYQLFTRNQSGSDYGFTGFNWNYTVGAPGDIAWNELGHNSFDTAYRTPFGAVTTGTPVTLRFRTKALNVDAVDLVVYEYDSATQATKPVSFRPMSYLEDRAEGGTTYAFWTVTVTTPTTPSILYYKFRITAGSDIDWYSDAYADNHDNVNQGGWGAPSDDEPFPSFQITVYDGAFSTPSWLQNATVYQIFPDRFRNGDPTNDYCAPGSTTGCPVFFGSQSAMAHTTWNDAVGDPRNPGTYKDQWGTQFFGGDLDGITEKLDYLKGIGIDTIYLTPIFKATSNHRYDTDNYLEVDPALGGQAAYDRLIAGLEARGMHLMLDGVFNHTSSDSVYFDRYHRYSTDGACESTSSPFRPWYEWNNSKTPCDATSYNGWFGYDSLAVLKDDSASVRDYIYRSPDSVVSTWYNRGASGWRFDVADEISHDWWRDFRGYAKKANTNGPLVGEVWHDASQFLLGDQLDSVMNYRFRKNILGFARGVGWKDNDNNGSNEIAGLTPSQFDHALRSVREDYPQAATNAMLNLVDSHDTNRALYVLTLQGDNGLAEAKQRQQLTALFQFTYLGAPMVYYGDEAALNSPSLANGTNGPEDDPYNRAPYPWADKAGDTSVYGPADSSMIDYYTKIAKLRQAHPALRTGSFDTLLTGDTTASDTDNSTFAFARSSDAETLVVALNNGTSSNTATIPVGFGNGTVLVDAISGTTTTVANGSVNLTLAARTGAVLMVKPADTTAPTVALSANPVAPESGWNTTPVTVTAQASDNESVASVSLSVDGTATTTAGATASAPVSADGTHAIEARATDGAGNVSEPASLTVKIDATAPTTTGTPAVDQAGQKATVTLAATDATSGVASTSYRIGDGATTPYTGPITLTGAGTYSVTFSSVDKAGNAEAAQSLTVTVPPPTSTGGAIKPTACVLKLGGLSLGIWGYTFDGKSAVQVPNGPKNSFTGSAIGIRPTTFYPGRYPVYFLSTVPAQGVTWTVTGPDGVARSATASPTSTRCL